MLGPPFDTLVTGKPWSGLMVVLEIVKLWPSPSFSGRGLFHYIADDESEDHNSSYDDDGGGGDIANAFLVLEFGEEQDLWILNRC